MNNRTWLIFLFACMAVLANAAPLNLPQAPLSDFQKKSLFIAGCCSTYATYWLASISMRSQGLASYTVLGTAVVLAGETTYLILKNEDCKSERYNKMCLLVGAHILALEFGRIEYQPCIDFSKRHKIAGRGLIGTLIHMFKKR